MNNIIIVSYNQCLLLKHIKNLSLSLYLCIITNGLCSTLALKLQNGPKVHITLQYFIKIVLYSQLFYAITFLSVSHIYVLILTWLCAVHIVRKRDIYLAGGYLDDWFSLFFLVVSIASLYQLLKRANILIKVVCSFFFPYNSIWQWLLFSPT